MQDTNKQRQKRRQTPRTLICEQSGCQRPKHGEHQLCFRCLAIVQQQEAERMRVARQREREVDVRKQAIAEAWAEWERYEPEVPPAAAHTAKEATPVAAPAAQLDEIDLIVALIDKLPSASASAWTSRGKPRVEALEELLGAPVSAQQRNEAWERWQADNAEDEADA